MIFNLAKLVIRPDKIKNKQFKNWEARERAIQTVQESDTINIFLEQKIKENNHNVSELRKLLRVEGFVI